MHKLRRMLALALFLGWVSADWSFTPPLLSGSAYPVGPRILLGESSYVQKACLEQNLATLLNSCLAPSAAAIPQQQPSMRDGAIRLLQSCLLTNTSTQTNLTMRFLAPTGFMGTAIANLSLTYQRTTGIRMEVEARNSRDYSGVRIASVNNPRDRSLTHDAWLITPSGVGDGIASGAFMDLSQLVLFDQRLQWQGLINQMRSVGLVYGSKVIALPLSAYSFQLFYRMDTFQANNWTVPVTWRGLAGMAERINGTNDMYGFCGLWGPCGNLGINLFKYILSSYQQTLGAPQGWLIDPDSMNLMLDTPAVAETLSILKRLFTLSPVDDNLNYMCATAWDPFVKGRCHMTIAFGTLYKYAAHVSNAAAVGSLQGNLGVAPLPGSGMVLDRRSNTLVPCDEVACPYATREATVNSTTGAVRYRLINQSPGFEAVLVPLNGQSSPTIKFYAFAVMSYITRPDVISQMVLDPRIEVLPTRGELLDPLLWQRAGYNLADARRYCSAHATAMSHPNLHVQLRVPGASAMVGLFGSVTRNLFASNGSVEAVFPTMQPQAAAILNSSFRGNVTALRLEYWSSINRQLPWPPPPFSSPSLVPTTPTENTFKDGLGTRDVIIIACVVGGTVTLVGLVLIVLRSRLMERLTQARTWRKHPGVGPDTTLLVTDIESSTMLWEALDAQVMDTSVKLHNACIRRLAADNKGYESVWEGDSFIIAFPTVLDALQFASAAQVALLHLDWPRALLQHPVCAEIRAVKADAAVTKRKAQALLALASPTQSPTHSKVGRVPSFDRSTRKGGQGLGPSSQQSVGERDAVQLILAGSDSMLRTSAHGSGQPLADASSSYGDANETGECELLGTCESPKLTQSDKQSSRTKSTRDFVGRLSRMTGGERNSFDVVRQSLSGQQGGGLGAAAYTVSELLKMKWRSVGSGKQGSQTALAFRGLRVRMGFHAGVQDESDIVFNKASGRYVYTGAIRKAANAVASAGKGGHIMMSSQTAARLGMDHSGTLPLLPDDVGVYYMGTHWLTDMPHTSVPLLLALPKALSCRLAVMDHTLRTVECVSLGCLAAPCSGPAETSDIVLVGMHISGLQSLMTWNQTATQEAVRQCMERVCDEAMRLRGVISEDGASLAVTDMALASGAADMLMSGINKESVVPGRVITAFADPSDALQFAVSVRHCLLTHDWGDELMGHPLCDRVVSNSDLDVITRASAMRPTPGFSPQSKQLPRLFDSPDRPSNLHPSRRSDVSRSAWGEASGIHPSAPNTPERKGTQFASRHAETDKSIGPDPASIAAQWDHKIAISPDRKSIPHNPRRSEGGKSAWGDSGKLTPMQLFVGQQNHAPMEVAFVPFQGYEDTYAVEASMLSGLRVRFVAVRGPAAMRIATRSSGRAVYSGTKTVRRLHKMLKAAKAGQLVIDGGLLKSAA